MNDSTIDIAPDVVAQLQADFPAEEIESRLTQLAQTTRVARIQRCIVFASRGHPWYFDYLCKLANIDYRDVIVAAEYDRLNARLYDFSKPIPEARFDHPYT